jgi:hypothetical protein
VNPDGHERNRVRKDERTLQDLLGRNPVRDVDDLSLGCDALHHPVARAHEVVLEAEVGQEGDEHALSVIALTARVTRAALRVARNEHRLTVRPRTRAPFAAELDATRTDSHERSRSLKRKGSGSKGPARDSLSSRAGVHC